jgi:hypothetical protein
VAGPVAGGEEANAETYKRKMEAIIVPSTRKDKTGKKRRVDFKIGGITTDSGSATAARALKSRAGCAL